ncbi:MAG TPA: hypothetical protein VF601_08990 [Beijerinckiaceae bacterium]
MFLKQFVIGRDFDDDAMLKRLKPETEALYAFRISFNPKHRILGGFLRPGEFVATAHRSRRELEDETWVPARTLAKDQWEALFPGIRRLSDQRCDLLKDFEL